MRIKVLSADCDTWYSDRIGEEFEVIYETISGYYVDNNDKSRDWHVHIANCCQILEPEFQAALITESPDPRLFTAAVAAMQGVLSGLLSKEGKIKTEVAARYAWDAAQDLINEGKTRGHIL